MGLESGLGNNSSNERKEVDLTAEVKSVNLAAVKIYQDYAKELRGRIGKGIYSKENEALALEFAETYEKKAQEMIEQKG